MLTQNDTIIINQIQNYINKHGGLAREWYVGIAAEPRSRLFKDHNVDETNGTWIFNSAGSSAAARRIEDHFLARGFDGGSGGGDASTASVYAYLKTSYTLR